MNARKWLLALVFAGVLTPSWLVPIGSGEVQDAAAPPAIEAGEMRNR